MVMKAALRLGITLVAVLAIESTMAPPPYALGEAQPAGDHTLDAIFARYSRGHLPGCAAAVFRDGKVLTDGHYGLANVENGVPIRSDTLFNVGSIAKQITALAVLILEHRGKLSLHDPIAKYIQGFPQYGNEITVYDLLHHTSGLRDADELFLIAGWHIGEDHITNGDVMNLMLRQKHFNFSPGTDYAYSNTNYFLLGRIIEHASGESYATFVGRNVLRPLGMVHTVVRDRDALVIPDRADGYVLEGDLQTGDTNDETTGDGNIFTTVGDLALWDENLDTGRVGGSAILAEMKSPGELRNGTSILYADGLELSSYKGLSTLEHGGADAGYHAYFLHFVQSALGVAVLCNIRDNDGPSPYHLATAIADIYLPHVTPKRSEHREAHAPRRPSLLPTNLVGSYVDAGGTVLQVSIRHGTMLASDDVQNPNSFTALRYVDKYIFQRHDGTSFRFTIDGDGKATSVRLTGPDQNIVYHRSRPPAQTDFHEFTGSYYSPEAMVVWHLFVRSNQLYLRVPRYADERLFPVLADGFHSDRWTLVFQRDRAGSVTALRVSNERLYGITFLRQHD